MGALKAFLSSITSTETDTYLVLFFVMVSVQVLIDFGHLLFYYETFRVPTHEQ